MNYFRESNQIERVMEIFTQEFKERLRAIFNGKFWKWTGVVAGVAAVVVAFFLISPLERNHSGEAAVAVGDQDTTIYEYGIPISLYDIEQGKVGKGMFFSTLLTKLDVPQNKIYALTQECKGIFDLRHFKVGNEYHAYFTKDSLRTLDYLVYEKDSHSYVVFGLKDSLSVTIHEKEIKTTLHYAEVTINNSLWSDLQSAGVTPLLALTLSDIYAWSIDFFGLQRGDSFKAFYEVISYKDDILDIGKVKYAVFNHAGTDYEVYHYVLDDQGNEYWNEKGESMRKAFLKAPLNYKRISSGFTYSRRHPITRKVQPHTGIDYAAPAGTPVVSIGDGVVVEKGYKGAGGHTVKIKHNSVYTSAYLHLSKYGKGIAVGSRVKQGQVIGYVGSTGRSTGPHLDFRIWKNGTPINPLTMKMPPAVPVPKDKMNDFESAKVETQRQISRIAAQQYFTRSLEFFSL